MIEIAVQTGCNKLRRRQKKKIEDDDKEGIIENEETF